jgi:hypothetical protein
MLHTDMPFTHALMACMHACTQAAKAQLQQLLSASLLEQKKAQIMLNVIQAQVEA